MDVTPEASPRATLVFCFPYKGVGGVSLLFLRMAEHLARTRSDLSLFLIDYADGFMSKNLKDERVRIIEYRDNGDVQIPEGAVVIFQSMTPWSIFPSLKFNESTRFLFWNCFPYNLVPRIPGTGEFVQKRPWLHRVFLGTVFRSFQSTCRRFTNALLSSDALVFMDAPNLRVTEWGLALKVKEPKFLPVCMETSSNPMNARPVARPLKAVWIGRIADFKAPILRFTLSKLSEFSLRTQTEIEFTVVGDGDKELEEAQFQNAFFKLKRVPFLSPTEVSSLLQTDTDVLFAMGTSALEGARFAVPTVLLDISYGDVPDQYLFRFFYEAREFSLGDLIDSERLALGGVKIDSVIEQVFKNREALGERCRSYFLANHSIDTVSRKLVDHALATRLTYSHLTKNGLLIRPLPYRIMLRLRALK